jgi:hypothetical protein
MLLAGVERKWWGDGPASAEGGRGGADILNGACNVLSGSHKWGGGTDLLNVELATS